MGKRAGLDKKDMRILFELDYDSRMPLSELAGKVGLSVQTAKYRLDRLFGEKVILGSTAVVDIHRLGYFTYRVYMRLQNATEKKEKEIIEYFVKDTRTIWVVSTSGRWDVEVLLAASGPVETNGFLTRMKREIGAYVKDYVVTPSIVNYHFERPYLTGGKERKKRNRFMGLSPQERPWMKRTSGFSSA